MRTALVSSLLFAVVSAGLRITIDTATADATSQATCAPYTLVHAPTTVTETYGVQSPLTLVDTETLGPQTDEATVTQPDAFTFTIRTLEPETFTVSITPPVKTITVTVTPDPEQQTQVNTRTVVETDRSTPATEVLVVTATRPAVTITTTLPAKTHTVTATLRLPDVTESTTLEASTASVSTTADPDTITITQEATHVDRTSVLATETRSVGPVCSTYAAASTCSCKFEIICDQAVNIDSNTFFHKIDFNTYFGDFASLSNGGLCSSYSGNPGLSGRQGRSGTKYFEKDGNVECSGCSS
ncbi:hypothetical protein FSST1_012643 [Fusarium sambucinum]